MTPIFSLQNRSNASTPPDSLALSADSSSRANSGISSMACAERRLTRISQGIVVLFLMCHVWKLIPTTYEAIESCQKWSSEQPLIGGQNDKTDEGMGAVVTQWPKSMVTINDISHLLLATNSAINFLMYIVL